MKRSWMLEIFAKSNMPNVHPRPAINQMYPFENWYAKVASKQSNVWLLKANARRCVDLVSKLWGVVPDVRLVGFCLWTIIVITKTQPSGFHFNFGIKCVWILIIICSSYLIMNTSIAIHITELHTWTRPECDINFILSTHSLKYEYNFSDAHGK